MSETKSLPAKRINSVADFLTLIERKYCQISNKYISKTIIFRGQKEDWPLIPKIGREELRQSLSLLNAEKKMIEELKRSSIPHLKFKPDTDWEWLALAQHHGLPTRLLDWTANPLAALWFCVECPSKGKGKDGVVWAINIEDDEIINLQLQINNESPFDQDKTKIFQPKHITSRIIAQNGWFTVHKYINKKQKFIAFENNKNYKERLEKFIIPSEKFSNIRKMLNYCGINAASMFPDLDGLCKLIRWNNISFDDEREFTGTPQKTEEARPIKPTGT